MGLVAFRCNARVRKFFEHVRDVNARTNRSDQFVANAYLRTNPPLRWATLPAELATIRAVTAAARPNSSKLR